MESAEAQGTLIIETPERVQLAFTLASIGNRFLAVMIDHFLQYFSIFLVFMFASFLIRAENEKAKPINETFSEMPAWTIAIVIITAFILFAGYFAFFEWLWNGQTPGKRVMKLRVVREDGRPITVWESISRNLLRIFDAMPSPIIPIYSVGLISIFASTRDQRIGDIFSGTVVIRERSGEIPTYDETFLDRTEDGILTETEHKVEFTADISKLTEKEITVVETFLRRRWDLNERQRLWMAWRVAIPIMYKLRPTYDKESFTYEGFLVELLRKYNKQRRFLN
ncbi:MAG: RDD family protein [Pyrinomonadaceae bacterium]